MKLKDLASLAALSIVVLTVAGCSIPERGPGVPEADTLRALPLGIANARFFADSDPGPMTEEGVRSVEREKAALRAAGKSTDRLPPAEFLAVSGGGDNGAFGAGLLNGWTQTGKRPEFKMVTGVSTGALIAPFAFLGPDYDADLRKAYTTMTADMIFGRRNLLAVLFSDAMADTGPLATLIASFADQAMLDAIAREYRKGRLLFVGTTDLDAERPAIWNIGAIAASGHPGALELFRKVLRASAAIPGAFPPMMIDVEVDGRKFEEMHIDGGAIAQLFLYPPSVDIAASGTERQRTAYIIRNSRLDPNHEISERRTVTIAARAIQAMLVASGRNDVVRTYFVARRDKVDYNLAYIGRDFTFEKSGEFDQAYMQALFDYGYRQAVDGQPWHKAPPGISRD